MVVTQFCVKRRHAPPSPNKRLKTVDEATYERTGALALEVFSSTELVEKILSHNAGIITWQAVSLLCTASLRAARSSIPLLRSVALYTGACTQQQLQQLFAVTWKEAYALPSETYEMLDSKYKLYRASAIDAVLEKYDNNVEIINKARPRVLAATRAKFMFKSNSMRRITNVKKIAEREDKQRKEYIASIPFHRRHRLNLA